MAEHQRLYGVYYLLAKNKRAVHATLNKDIVIANSRFKPIKR